jgi:hypothetical protein
MADVLTFEQETHTYRYGERVIPSVTQILQPLQGLQAWIDGARSEYERSRRLAILEAASDFGTNVHLACHLFNIGELDEAALDPSLAPYLAGYKLFLSETGFVVTGSEVRVLDKLKRYAGTCDLYGLWKNTTWAADLKSGIVPTTVGAQLAAYQEAAPERPRRRLCIQLKPNAYKLHECKEVSDFSLFNSALNVHQFQQIHKLRNEENANQFDAYA